MDFTAVDRGTDHWLTRGWQSRAQIRGRAALGLYKAIYDLGMWERVQQLLGDKQAKGLLENCEDDWVSLDNHLRIVEHALIVCDRSKLLELGGALGGQCLGAACRYGVLRKASDVVGPMAQLLIVQAPLMWEGAFRNAGRMVLDQVGMRLAKLSIEEAPLSLGLSTIWQTLMEGAIVWGMSVVGARAHTRIYSEARSSLITLEVRWEKLPECRPIITTM